MFDSRRIEHAAFVFIDLNMSAIEVELPRGFSFCVNFPTKETDFVYK